MNLGKSYKKEEFSPEQRLLEVERKFDVILEKIQKYDEVLDKFAILQKELFNLASKQKEHEDKSLKLNIALENDLSGISSQLKQSDFQQRNLGSNLSDLGRKLDSHKDDSSKKISELFGISEHLKSDILKRLDAYVPASYHQAHYSALNTRVNELTNDLEMQEVKENARNQALKDHSAKLADLENRLNSQNPEVIHQKFQSALEAHKNATKDDILSSMSVSNNRMLDLKESLQTALLQMKQEIMGTPSALETVRKEIMTKLEMASMDGNNAMIKAGNVAKKIDLLEKKLENVNLILQKNDIK